MLATIAIVLLLFATACRTVVVEVEVTATPEPICEPYFEEGCVSPEVLAGPMLPCLPSWATYGWFIGYEPERLEVRQERIRDFLNELGLQELDGFKTGGMAAGDLDNTDTLLWEIHYSVVVPITGRVERQARIFIEPETCKITLVEA